MDDPSIFFCQRHLDAAPADVYAAFADPAKLAAWWGPAGFRNTFEVFEFREGGSWKFVMHGPDGTDHPNESRFVTLREPELIVIDHCCPPYFVLTVQITAADAGSHISWTGRFADARVAERLRPIIGPANEQNLDRLQALLAGAAD